MDHDAYLLAIREQSERFLEALATVDDAAPVPTCPGWTAGDLLRHLGEVQHEWAQIARGTPADEMTDPDHPADAAGLRASVARAGTELLAALAERPPQTACWSWHPAGGTLGWVARRMVHEALVHRVDAESAAGLEVRPPSVELAADGVDEVLAHFVDGVPAWGTFAPDGVRVRLACTNAPRAWVLELGRFTGTSPDSGTAHDLDAAAVHVESAAPDGEGRVDATLAGHAWDLDRWLWGRGTLDAVEVSGDPAAVERVRALLREATQ